MSAREEILSTIRRSLGVTGQEKPRLDTVTERLANAPRGLTVARGQLPHEGQVALFKEQAEATLASVVDVASYQDVPAAVADYLRQNNLPAQLRIGSDPRMADLDWGKTAIELSDRKSVVRERV